MEDRIAPGLLNSPVGALTEECIALDWPGGQEVDLVGEHTHLLGVCRMEEAQREERPFLLSSWSLV